MRKVVALVFTFVILFSLCGCGGKVPDNFTRETYSLGVEALEVMDDYLSGKKDKNQTSEKLMEILDKLDEEKENIAPDPDSESYSDDLVKMMSNSGVGFWVSAFGMGMSGIENEHGVIHDCQEMRDSLAETLEGIDLE